MLGAVRPFKTADIDLQNAKLFWEVHNLMLAVGGKRSRCGRGARGARRARGAMHSFEVTPRKTEAGAEEDEKTDGVLNARFQIMGPCHADDLRI